MSRPLRVAVLAGGRSSEHAISRESARSVLEGLDRGRFETTLIDISRDGRWEITDGGQSRLPADEPALETLPVIAGSPPAAGAR